MHGNLTGTAPTGPAMMHGYAASAGFEQIEPKRAAQPRGNSAHERGPARLVVNDGDGSKYQGYHKSGTDRHQDRGGGHGTPGSQRPGSS